MGDLFLFKMIIKDLKYQFEKKLQNSFSLSELRFLFPVFLEEIFCIPIDSQRFRESEILKGDKQKWIKAIEDLKKGIPYQYVLGSSLFYGLNIKVDQNTLIPRPETEELLDIISREKMLSPKSIADFGCGSGCISLALKKIFQNALVYGYDISEKALEIASKNSLDSKLAVHFSILDLRAEQNLNRSFDLIVSNPPYVRELEKTEMSRGVLDFEPHLALFVQNEDPLVFYRALARIGEKYLNQEGRMYFEINQYLSEETKEIFITKGWDAKLIKDMSGNWRFLKVWK